MTNVAIVYFSGVIYTHLMAQAIAKGVSQAEETTVELLQITGEQIVNSRCKNKGKKESEIIGIHFLPNYS